MKYLDFRQIKEVPITDILLLLGVTPAKMRQNDWTYYTPWRADNHPSLHVRLANNTWKDFGDATSGTSNIDLLLRMGIAADAYSAAEWINDHFLGGHPAPVDMTLRKQHQQAATTTTTTQILSSRPVTNQELLVYYAQRGIPPSIVQMHCKEVTFVNRDGKQRTIIGFENVKGGYALRGPQYKGNIGPAAFTIIPGDGGDEVNIFEGFIDFLSFRCLFPGNHNDCDCIILNSVIFSGAVTPIIEEKRYKVLHAFLDADDAGRKALITLRDALTTLVVVDHSGLYADIGKDLNDYLQSNISHEPGYII